MKSPVEDLLRAVLQKTGSAEMVRQLDALLGKQEGDNGAAEAVIYTAFPISDSQIQRLKDKLEARFKAKLFFRTVEDRSLIGGVRIVVGDSVLDASVKGSLEKMKQTLAA